MQGSDQEARVRISLQAGEFEVEGSEAFVRQYDSTIQSLLERLRNSPAPKRSEGGGAARNASGADASGSPDDFPEALHGMTSKSGTDQILVAGYFASMNAADGTFATGEANKLLVEQGIKLPNPSQSVKNNLQAKRVFKVGNRYKVSKTGSDYLRTQLRNIEG